MSFVMPSKYGSDLPVPKDPSVTINEVPRKTVAVVAFSGLFLTIKYEITNNDLKFLLLFF